MGLGIGYVFCYDAHVAVADALDGMLNYETERALIEGSHICVQSHPFCRWVLDGMSGYDDFDLVSRYGHGLDDRQPRCKLGLGYSTRRGQS